MKKKQQIKELKAHNLELQNKLNVANMDCNVWEGKYKDLESLESGFIKIGVADYDMLLNAANPKNQPNQVPMYREDLKELMNEAMKANRYKKALEEKEQLLHEANVTKDALKERLYTSKAQTESCMSLLKEIANLLEMDEHAALADIPKSIINLCANFAHANGRAERFLKDKEKQGRKIEAQKQTIEALNEQVNILNQVDNRDNERYAKNRESQLFTAEYYRRGEEIEELKTSLAFWEKSTMKQLVR